MCTAGAPTVQVRINASTLDWARLPGWIRSKLIGRAGPRKKSPYRASIASLRSRKRKKPTRRATRARDTIAGTGAAASIEDPARTPDGGRILGRTWIAACRLNGLLDLFLHLSDAIGVRALGC